MIIGALTLVSYFAILGLIAADDLAPAFNQQA